MFLTLVFNKLKEFITLNPQLIDDKICPRDFEYEYEQTENGKSYKLKFCLERDTVGILTGFNIATPDGISVGSSMKEIK